VSTAQTYTLKAQTDMWTGDVSRKGERLISTGLLGSIRWWFEVVVRGLGGSACDPSHHKDNKPGPCPEPGRKPHGSGHHCVVCELFGCTGWARKFRFEVLDEHGKTKLDQIKAGQTFQLRFTPLRRIVDEEWALLDATIRLIADYGAIGGKTVYKPSDEQNQQNQAHHRDYGLIKISQNASVKKKTIDQIKAYVADNAWRKPSDGEFAWAALDHFWCVNGRYLARQKSDQSAFNRVIGRPEPKAQASRNDSWLAGRRAGQDGPESKKVFSFKNPPRSFGFVQSTNKLDEMRQHLKDKAWGDLKDNEFLKGGAILAQLIGQGGAA
jgi:CRISPR-associated protein Cmr1